MKLFLPLLLTGVFSAWLLSSLPQRLDAATALSTPKVSAPESFTVDGGHSSVLFRVEHMKTSLFYGRFNELEGQLVLDEGQPEGSSVEITVQAASVDTNDAKRDQHITGPDFLDAKQFPTISFKSEKVSREGGVWKAEGKLSLHGVTKTIALEFEQTGEGKGFKGEKLVGFHTRFEIDRTEFGMDYSSEMLGESIELTISLEAGASE